MSTHLTAIDGRGLNLKYFISWRPYLWQRPVLRALKFLGDLRGKRLLFWLRARLRPGFNYKANYHGILKNDFSRTSGSPVVAVAEPVRLTVLAVSAPMVAVGRGRRGRRGARSSAQEDRKTTHFGKILMDKCPG